ncbi:MAG: hypothetical protein H3C48_14560 [Chitinophagaceae bacterium]|nr:hypothetical protein [Chitinophagaceae bacterium]
MAHWLGNSPDSLIIYNDYWDHKFISVIMNLHAREEKRVFPYAVGAVTEDDKKAVTLNFARSRLTRQGYGCGYLSIQIERTKNISAKNGRPGGSTFRKVPGT